MQKWRAAIRYVFSELVLFNLLFTFLTASLVYSYDEKSYVYVFWIKILGFLTTIWAYLQYRKPRLYFFYNLGISRASLFISTFLLDALVSLLVFYIIITLK